MRDVTALMPPGFTQLQRDDALFAYLQQQAVMFYAGSWDYGVLVRDGAFPTGVVTLPNRRREAGHLRRLQVGAGARCARRQGRHPGRRTVRRGTAA
jgi:multiple sugar transport system substrate-binding protein/raffinose/stachyose/melibiose transport system substrate-binding protein